MKETKQTQKSEPLNPLVESRKAFARVKFLKISPRKMRLVIDTIRHEPIVKAFPILMTVKKKAARMTEKLLKSAVANAKVLGMNENRLYVSEVRADGGTVMKRFMSRSMGRADRIIKRTTHLSITLKEGTKEWKTFGTPQSDAASLDKAAEQKKKKTIKQKA
ncbi:MAG: 50S ribosomal protein L22 [Candidatus Omnitrophica bacterium]|nr:50S ribosomal protein L22 [Candidatus Omnitrophota bacterium]